MNTATQFIREQNESANLLARFFDAKERVEMRGMKLQPVDDLFVVSMGKKVLLQAETISEVDEWLDDIGGVI